jgi:hypothetical protein
MTGSALMDFLIAVISLCGVVYLVFMAIDMIAPDERFKQLGRFAVGFVALISFLVAIKGVLFGGGGGLTFSAMGMIDFAISVIVLIVVVYIIYMVIDFFATPFTVQIKYVVGAIALIVILVVAEKALFGGGLGLVANFTHLEGPRATGTR